MANIMIWDWPVRLLHWLMVLLFTGLIVTGKGDGDYMDWHFYMGYGLSAVIIARVLYGVLGSEYARFKQFLYQPQTVLRYAKGLLVGNAKHYLGHNPVGGLMVVALLLALTLQWGSGLFISDEIFLFGPFYGAISDDWTEQLGAIHHSLPDILLILVATHILAVLYHEIRFKERLVAAMLHGKKTTHEPSAALTVKTPRIGVIVSMIVALAWLGWLWSIPV